MGWLNTIHAVTDDMLESAQQLRELAKAFARTGNYEVSGELKDIASRLSEQSVAVSRAASEKLTEDCAHSRHMAGSILSGILGGAVRPPERTQA